MGSLETRAEQFGVFAFLAIVYGVSVGGLNVQNTFNQIFAPWPTFQNLFHFQSCNLWDIGCDNQNVQTATASIAIAINYPSVLFFTILGRISAFGSLMIGVFFGPEIGLQAVPYLDIFFLLVLVVVPLIEIFRLFRGNSSGSTL